MNRENKRRCCDKKRNEGLEQKREELKDRKK